MNKGKFITTIKKFSLIVGPGIFLLGCNIGTDSVVTMAKAGAEYGMQFVGTNPPFIVVTAMNFQAFILSAVVIPIIILMHNKKIMKGHENHILSMQGWQRV